MVKQILTVVGARPQFIKAAPVSRALERHGLREILLHTGQHYDRGMSDVFFTELELKAPDVSLQVGSGSHAEQTGAMMVGIERAIQAVQPDWVLIYGDTNSTLAGALAASKAHVPIAHVEAGLRSFNRRMPEEINRIVADALSSRLFVPTETAHQQLIKEGHREASISRIGDVMLDAMLMIRPLALAHSRILEELGLCDKQFVLATLHRAENTDDPARLKACFEGLARVSKQLPVVMPLHPRTASRLGGSGNEKNLGLRIVPPLGFLDMMRLEMAASVIATDSGGVQKEAFFHGVPAVTLRDETEWVELIELGWNRLCPPVSAKRVFEAVLAAVGSRGQAANPYGHGHAAELVADFFAL
jgi:UDP-GlcNAc3NAcA epimerase